MMSEKTSQPRFSSTLGFVATAAGSAVGLGNIWRFPYEVGAHGGAGFLFIYFICVVLLGYPLVVAELAFGKKMRAGLYSSCQQAGTSLWRFVSTWIFLTLVLDLSIYNTIASQVCGYLVETVTGHLLPVANAQAFFDAFSADVPRNIAYTLLSLLPAALIIKNGVQNGMEKWSKILMPLFCLLLLSLVGYAFTLPNAWEGVAFYIVPDFSAITLEVVFSALTHAFFSLSVGMGIMITYGAYMPRESKILPLAAVVVISDTLIAFLAGLFLFPFIFSQGIAPSHGANLVFIALPLVFQSLGPVMGLVVGSSFFLLLSFAALTTIISLLEVMAVYIMERWKVSRPTAVYSATALVYLGTIPNMLSNGGAAYFTRFWTVAGQHYSFFSLSSGLLLEGAILAGCFLFILALAYQWQQLRLFETIFDEEKAHQGWIGFYLKGMIVYGSPVLLGLMLLLKVLRYC